MSETNILNRSLQNHSVVQKIVDQITEAILRGELRPGDRLPTEAELCSSMGVGRNSVREAIKILEAYGVAEIRRADGTYICSTYSRKMLDPMLYGMLLMQSSGTEIIQLRQVMDAGILHLMISTITGDGLKMLEHACRNLEAAMASGLRERIMEADISFHLAIARLAGNDLLLTVYSYVDRITTPSRLSAMNKILDAGRIQDFLSLHQQLIEILRYGRAEQIETALSDHYMFWKQL